MPDARCQMTAVNVSVGLVTCTPKQCMHAWMEGRKGGFDVPKLPRSLSSAWTILAWANWTTSSIESINSSAMRDASVVALQKYTDKNNKEFQSVIRVSNERRLHAEAFVYLQSPRQTCFVSHLFWSWQLAVGSWLMIMIHPRTDQQPSTTSVGTETWKNTFICTPPFLGLGMGCRNGGAPLLLVCWVRVC